MWTNTPHPHRRSENYGIQGGGVSYQQVRNIFFGKFLPFFVKLYVLLKSAENFVNLSKVKHRKVI